MELCQIWGTPGPELGSKIKFAKYHALRIAKAIKAGEDPNLSNPTPEPSPGIDQAAFEPGNPDVRELSQDSAPSMQPTVDDVPEHHLAQDRIHPDGPSPQDRDYYQSSTVPEVSPLVPQSTDRRMSEGGGYFPQVSPEILPPAENHSPNRADPMASPAPLQANDALHSFPPPGLRESHVSPERPPNVPVNHPSPPAIPTPTPVPRGTQLRTSSDAKVSQRPSQLTISEGHFRDDEGSIAAAQKHAKFAISALNFEDVQTGVKELREALKALGAT